MSYIRSSVDGPSGSGKTCTMAQLAVGLALEYGNGAPVIVFDSNNRWRPWKKLIFDVEKVPLEIYYGESIAVLQKAAAAAMRGPCSVFVADDLTVPWKEGLASFAYENGNLTFERRAQLLNEWRQFVSAYQHGAFHSLAAGRVGYVWENVENPETGEEELHQGDAKFNAGGGENFGYDADLELAMRRKVRKIFGLFRGKLAVEHILDVRKDGVGGLLSGKQFAFPEWPDGLYRPGMYKPVLNALRPHIDFVRSLDEVAYHNESSAELIRAGRTNWSQDQANRKNLLEEISALLDICFPGGEGKSKTAKMFRDLTLEYLNGFISFSRMEDEVRTDLLERNVMILRKVRARVNLGEIPTDQNSLRCLLDLSTDDLLHPGKSMSLLEAMGLRSLAAQKTTGKVA